MSLREQTIEIYSSLARLMGILDLGVVMTSLSGAIAIGLIPVENGSFVEFIAWVGVLFFGACTVLISTKLFGGSKPVVTLSSEGLLDTRITRKPIPWSEMEDIGVWASNGQKIIVIAVPAEIERNVGLSRMARMTRSANTKLGADGLCVVTTGLKMSHDELLDAILVRAEEARVGLQP